MIIFKSINKLNKEVDFKADIGFVPTMGSLHNGHIYLIKSSKKYCKKTLVSIFINPTQFNKKKDLKRYPKNLQKDIKILKRLKVDYLLTPRDSEIYQKKIDRKIQLNKNDKIMCSLFRPGHFEGVLAVINQFLKKIKPKKIFLGEKDYQQLFLINKFIKKKFNIKVIPCKNIRDKNNITLSSRNILLNKKDLIKSSFIANLLLNFKKKLKKNPLLRNEIPNIKKIICDVKDIKLEYLEIRNKKNLTKKFTKNNFKIFISYYNKKVRLIDNF